MKKLYTLSILQFVFLAYCLLPTAHSFSQSPAYLWAKSAGGTYADYGYSIATDANGNVLVTGYFYSSTLTFGTTTLTNADNTGSSQDIFIVKYDASGNTVWAKSAGGTSDDYVRSIATDANGNVLVTGFFQSPTITFGTTTLTNAGSPNADMFIVKYDASGNVLWAKSAGGTSFDEGLGIATDANGNVLVTGFFQSPTITFGTTTLTNAGSYDMFIVKYDASGNVLWAKSAGGINDDVGNSIAMDASGNVLVTGYFYSANLTFGTTTLTNAGSPNADMFIVKYDASGNVLWAQRAGGTSNDYGFGIATDASGNVLVTGYFGSDTLTFGTTTLTNAGGPNADIFIVKYDASGNVLWAKSAGGTSSDFGYSIATDANGNVLVTGYFQSPTIAFGTTTLTNAGSYDIFIVKYDASGNVLWAQRAGGTSSDEGTSIATAPSGNVLVTGYFQSPTLTFGTTTLTNADNTGNTYDIFIAKLEGTPLSVTTTQTNVTCNGGSNGTAAVTASGGATPYTYLWSSGATVPQVTNVPAGTYSVTVTDANSVTATATVAITQPPLLVPGISKTDVSCNGGTNGTATVTASGGTTLPLPYGNGFDGAVSISTTQNLNADIISTGRNYADGIAYRVNAPADGASNVSRYNATDVLSNGIQAGDELLLINMQGIGSDNADAGNYEFVKVASVSAGQITFTNPITKSYDGASAVNQKVVVQRIPQYTNVSVTGSGVLTAFAWDGLVASPAGTGGYHTGIVAFRANGTVTINAGGKIDAKGKGYQPAQSTPCAGVQGESYTGGGTSSTAANGGGGGGGYNNTNTTGCDGSAGAGAGGSYGSAGSGPSGAYNSASAGTTYGDSTLGKLFFGSPGGYGSIGYCAGGCYWGGRAVPGNGGGIIFIASVAVTAYGSIDATAGDVISSSPTCDCMGSGGGSGGSVYLISSTMEIGADNVTASGSAGSNGTSSLSGYNGGTGGKGRVRLDYGTLSGTTTPASYTASVYDAPYYYSWNTVPSQASQTATGLTAGNHIVTVTDANGCTATDSITITQPLAIIANAGIDAGVCSGTSTTIGGSPSANGGTSPYSYSWSPSTDLNSSTVSNPSASPSSTTTYVLNVTDTNNCTNSDTVVMIVSASPVISAVQTNVTCNGGSNGTATASGGVSYQWSNGQTTDTAVGLSAGIYIVAGSAANGCSATDTVVITQPPAISLVLMPSAVCSGGSDGTITVAASGGTSPYSYLWSNGGNTQTIAALTAGAYTVTVTDSSACTAIDSAAVPQLPAISISLSQTNVTCNGGSNGTATASASGGTPPFSYIWNNNNQTTATATGLIAGTFFITVTDSMSCTAISNVTITEPSALAVYAGGDKTICAGATVGIGGGAGGGTAPLTFLWSPSVPLNSDTFEFPTANPSVTTNFIMTVTDANGCSSIDTILVIVNVTPVANAGADAGICNGAGATLTASGGTSYLWNNGATTAGITVSPSSTTIYSVTASDINGCSATDSVMITVFQPSGQNSWTQKANFGGIARDVATSFSIGTKGYIGTGGDGTNNYKDFWEWDQATNVWTQKADFAGTARRNAVGFSIGTKGYVGTGYDGTVKKDFWEWDQATNVWSQKTNFGGAGRYCATGFSIGNKGYIGTGNDAGSTNYQDFWEWDQGTDVWTQKANFGGAARYYAVSFSINTKGYIGTGYDLSTLYQDFWEWDQSTNVWTQKANFGGTARQVATGFSIGTKGYIGTGNDGTNNHNDFWEWDQATNVWTVKANFGGTARNAAVSFSIGAKGYVGTGDDGTFTLDFWEFDPSAAIISGNTVICSGDSSTLTASGGASYLWNNGAATASISVNPASSTMYFVTTTDNNGCSATDSIVVVVNPLPAIAASVQNPGSGIICIGDTATLAGGSIDTLISFVWTPGPVTGATVDVWPLSTTNYLLSVTDNHGCSNTDSVTLTVNPKPVVTISANPSAICTNDSTTLNAGGAVSYLWDNGVTSSSFTANLATTTTYNVTGTDNNGCSATDSATITVNANPVANAGADTTICNGTGATLNASGGTSYLWNNGATASVISVNPASTTNYSVTVTDNNGCTATDTVMVNVLPSPSVNAGPDVSFCNNASTTLTATGAISYSWSPATGLNSTTGATVTANPSVTTTYTVTGTDANGCSATDAIALTVNPNPTASAFVINNVWCNGGYDGSMAVNAGGGTPPLTYNWTNGATTDTINGLIADTFLVTVTDANGCWVQAYNIITEPPAITASTSATNSTCAQSNGSASLTVNGGSSPYTYLWSNGGTTASINNISYGAYSVTVTDANNCTKTATAAVSDISGPTVTVTGTVNANCGGPDGSATLTVNGGTSPYNYSWSNGSGGNNLDTVPPGNYSVTVTDVNLCNGIATLSIGNTGTNPPSVSGNVTDSLNGFIINSGAVRAYKVSTIPGQFDLIATATIDVNGNYFFPSLLPIGNYIFLAVADTASYPNSIPTYYGYTYKWDSATVVSIACDTVLSLNMQVIDLTPLSGTSNLTGIIVSIGPNKWGVAIGDPVPGVDISLEQVPGGIKAKDVTDSTGTYLFANVPQGNYQIYVDVPGLPMDTTYNIDLTTNDSTVNNLDFYVGDTIYTAPPLYVTEIKTADNTEIRIYPNPFNSFTNFEYTLKEKNDVKIEVYNLLGEKIFFTNNKSQSAGKYVERFDSKEFGSTGIYFVKFTVGNYTYSHRIVQEN